MRLTWPVVFIISSTPDKLSSLHLTYLQPTWWIQVLGKLKELDQTLALEFSRQEYWSGLPFPSPGNLPNPGIEPASLMSLALAAGFFATSAIWEAQNPNNDLSTYWFLWAWVRILTMPSGVKRHHFPMSEESEPPDWTSLHFPPLTLIHQPGHGSLRKRQNWFCVAPATGRVFFIFSYWQSL